MRYVPTVTGGKGLKGFDALPAAGEKPVYIDESGNLSVGKVARSRYEFSGGLELRTTGAAGASDVGSNVSYTQDLVNAGRWMRFGFSEAQQLANDVPYWTDPTPSPAAGIGLFGGKHLPENVTRLFDFSFNSAGYSSSRVYSWRQVPDPDQGGQLHSEI